MEKKLIKVLFFSVISMAFITSAFNLSVSAQSSNISAKTETQATSSVFKLAKNQKKVKRSARKGLRYYIEFRSRPNGAADHSYIAYGRLTRRGKPHKTKYIGLHPKGGTMGMVVGMVAMDAQLDPMPEDKTATPIASYRVPLTRKEYKTLLATIKAAKKDTESWGTWNWVLNNCNSFVGHVARSLGFKAPSTSVMGPTTYVETLRNMNENDYQDTEML